MNLKYSMYNVFQPFNGRMLCYNSVTDKFMLLENALYELLEASINTTDIAGLEEIHPDFYDALRANGFIVDNALDEYQEVRKQIIEVDQDESSYKIIINPTMNCNFKCWYCYESHIRGSKMSEETIEKVYRFIDNIVDRKSLKHLILSWFGGEPLLYFEKTMIPILKHANTITKEKNILFSSDITTNGYLIKPSMVDNFKKYNLNHAQITLDGNRERHNTIRNINNRKGSYDEIITGIKLLCQSCISVTMRINYTKETLIDIQDILTDISDLEEASRKLLNIAFQQVWQTKDNNNNEELSDKIIEIKDIFREAGFKVSKGSGLMIKHSCYADKTNEAVINYNGEIFKCTARDFTNSNSEGLLNPNGTIEWFEKNHVRLMAKLNNKPCQDCSILPLCGSGCSQVAFEKNGEDYCVYEFDTNRKKSLVKEHFMASLSL